MIGSGVHSSRTTSTNSAATEITLNQAIHVLANQSSSCPLSSTTCKVASQTVSSPKPMASIVPAFAFLM